MPKFFEKFPHKKYESLLIKIQQFQPLPIIYPDPPPWILSSPTIFLDLTSHSRTNTNSLIINKQLTEILNTRCSNSIQCYTDGSKSKNGVACAFSIQDDIYNFKLNPLCSVYSAELIAIFLCLEHLTQSLNNRNYVILTP